MSAEKPHPDPHVQGLRDAARMLMRRHDSTEYINPEYAESSIGVGAAAECFVHALDALSRDLVQLEELRMLHGDELRRARNTLGQSDETDSEAIAWNEVDSDMFLPMCVPPQARARTEALLSRVWSNLSNVSSQRPKLAMAAERWGIDSTAFDVAGVDPTEDERKAMRAAASRLIRREAVERLAAKVARERHAGISPRADVPPSDRSVFAHSEDFSWIVWRGREYRFSKGNQAESIRALWQSWERSGRRDGCGLSEQTVAERVGSSDENFRLQKVFRGHTAWGTVIRPAGKGIFALFASESQDNPTS